MRIADNHERLGSALVQMRADYDAASGHSSGPWKHPVQPRQDHLTRHGPKWIMAALAWILAGLIFAWIAGGGLDKAFGNIATEFQAERLNH